MRNLPKSYTEILDMPYRWPAKGDRLLRKTNDWDSGVSFSGDGPSRHVHIWDGYMSAGEALVEDCRRNPQERQFLIYPILFVYRHALELAMKWFLTMYGGYAADTIRGHDLWQLWQLCRPVIEVVGSGDGSIDVVQTIVKDMHDLDKSAIAFRYGMDKNSNPPKLPDGLYDPEHISDVMSAVKHFFDGTDGMLSNLAATRP